MYYILVPILQASIRVASYDNFGVERDQTPFMDQEGEDIILQAYTEYLMGQDKLGLIPWYVARLPSKDQLPLFSAFLTGITDREDQRLCLYLGREAGLDMDKVVVASVSKARLGDKHQMVDSLAWLGHDLDTQAGDLITQANCVVRKLLLEGDTELARTGARMVPTGLVEKVGREMLWKEEVLEGLNDKLNGGIYVEWERRVDKWREGLEIRIVEKDRRE